MTESAINEIKVEQSTSIWEAMQAQVDIADLMEHYRHDRGLST